MRVFVSYKETGVELAELEKRLGQIKSVLEFLEYEFFIFWYDARDKITSPAQILPTIKEQIQQADLVMALINHSQKSEWQLLELWMASAWWKPIVVFVQEEMLSWYRLVDELGEKVVFKDFDDFWKKLFEYFGLHLPRSEIDKVDSEILALLAQRFKRVAKVAKFKKLFSQPLFQPQRRERVLRDRVELAQQYGLSEEFIKKIWQLIHEEALSREKMEQ